MESVTDADVPFTTLEGHKSKAKVVYVYDGDTVYLVYEDSNKQYQKVHARLAGIDTPEMTKTSGIAKLARNALISLVTNISLDEYDTRSSPELKYLLDKNTKVLYAIFKGKEKYGRELVELYDYEDARGDFSKSINQKLIDTKHAKPYYGGTKVSW